MFKHLNTERKIQLGMVVTMNTPQPASTKNDPVVDALTHGLDLDWILGNIYSQRQLLGIGTGCPEK